MVMMDHSKVTENHFWMIQSAKKEVFPAWGWWIDLIFDIMIKLNVFQKNINRLIVVIDGFRPSSLNQLKDGLRPSTPIPNISSQLVKDGFRPSSLTQLKDGLRPSTPISTHLKDGSRPSSFTFVPRAVVSWVVARPGDWWISGCLCVVLSGTQYNTEIGTHVPVDQLTLAGGPLKVLSVTVLLYF